MLHDEKIIAKSENQVQETLNKMYRVNWNEITKVMKLEVWIIIENTVMKNITKFRYLGVLISKESENQK